MSAGWFVTGTDTGVGKTRVACALMTALARRGLSVLGMKPVATGCQATPDGLRNDDALALLACCTVPVGYEAVNPVAYAVPTAPHLAARSFGGVLSPEWLSGRCAALRARADVVVVEGVGGFLTPLGAHGTMADLASRLGWPLLLVVGVRLGALNHALLTAEAISHRGLTLAGWVASRLDPDPLLDEYPAALSELLAAPCLGVLPYAPMARASEEAGVLDLSLIDPAPPAVPPSAP